MSVVDKGNVVLIPFPKEKHAPPMKPKGIMSGCVLPKPPAPKEGVSVLRYDGYISLSFDAPAWELTKKKQLALTLKASMDTVL